MRSVLAEDDEELEIVPHVKGSTDFEIYESVVIKPRETILPWDENSQTSFELKYTVKTTERLIKRGKPTIVLISWERKKLIDVPFQFTNFFLFYFNFDYFVTMSDFELFFREYFHFLKLFDIFNYYGL